MANLSDNASITMISDHSTNEWLELDEVPTYDLRGTICGEAQSVPRAGSESTYECRIMAGLYVVSGNPLETVRDVFRNLLRRGNGQSFRSSPAVKMGIDMATDASHCCLLMIYCSDNGADLSVSMSSSESSVNVNSSNCSSKSCSLWPS